MKATDNTERKKTIRKMSFDEMKDKYIGIKGTPERDSYELELKVEVLGKKFIFFE